MNLPPNRCNLCQREGGVLLPYKQFVFHPPCYRKYMERTGRGTTDRIWVPKSREEKT